jgi:phosphatidylethanolamine-binding protein (PEBP) family uncharacterized protein
MNFQVLNFYNKDTQITKKYLCKKNGGENKSPHVIWKKIPDAKSYSLIMEDTQSVNGTTIHWFIPTIYNGKNIYGLNFYNKFGWYGPCPPSNTGIHKYVFVLYSLDQKFDYNIEKPIESSKQYEQILKNNNISILNKETVTFDYNTN